MSKKSQVLLEKQEVKKVTDVEKKGEECEVFIMGKSYNVPAGLTIMKAIEYAGTVHGQKLWELAPNIKRQLVRV